METVALRFSIVLLVFLVGCGGIIFLQIYLSKMESKIAGLILPIISICIALMVVSGNTLFSAATSTMESYDENGVLIERIIETDRQQVASTGSVIATVVSVFLICNIPTAVLLMIYFGCKEKQNSRKALERMQVQDLE